MFKKVIPFVLILFVSACANTQPNTASGNGMNMPCCEKCECCKSNVSCAECCKSGQCSCCKDGQCACKGESGQMCKDMKGASSAGDAPCPMCAKSEREWEAKQSKKR